MSLLIIFIVIAGCIILLETLLLVRFIKEKSSAQTDVVECKTRVVLANIALKELGLEKKALNDRVIELEDGIQRDFHVRVRNEITKMECKFDKNELVYIIAGIHKLLESPGTTIEDKEYFIKLYKKIQSTLDNMEETESD